MYNKSNLTFKYKNQEFNYCINSHNTRGTLTERVVEIPLLYYYLSNISDPIEIGCVSPYYWETRHKIYDLTDSHPKCERQNAKNIELKNNNIVSISTIEHFDMENYDIPQTEQIDSIEYINNIITQSNRYLITVPLGYNPKLTNYLIDLNNQKQNISFIARSTNSWIQKSANDLSIDNLNYNKVVWYANSICVIENIF